VDRVRGSCGFRVAGLSARGARVQLAMDRRDKPFVWALLAAATVWTITILFAAVARRYFGIGEDDFLVALVETFFLVTVCWPLALVYVLPILSAESIVDRACALPAGAVGAARGCLLFVGCLQLIVGAPTVCIAPGGAPSTLTAIGAAEAALLLLIGALRDVMRWRWLDQVGAGVRVELVDDRSTDAPALVALGDKRLDHVLVAMEEARQGPYRSSARRRPLLRLGGHPVDVRLRLGQGAALQIELAVLLAALSAIASF